MATNTTTRATIERAAKAVESYTRPVDDPWVEFGTKPTIIRKDVGVVLSAEDGRIFADYYDGAHKNSPDAGIDPALCRIAAEHLCHWEWINPGEVGLYAN